MYKKVNMVMLPTNEKATNIVKILKDTISYTTSENIPGGIYQHLYITSNDEIIEGDYCIDGDEVFGPYEKQDIAVIGFEKIIATTDSSLLLEREYESIHLGKGQVTYYKLPQPSQSFITKFVNEYNKGNVITEVMVEYLRGSGGHYDENEVWHWVILGLLINQDNTINIKPVKDSWSREEVVEFIRV